MGRHKLTIGMGSDFDLSDILKPHLSPVLPHWKRTRVSAGQLDHNVTIASTLTFQASLITSTTPRWKRTRVLAGQMWTRDLESLVYLFGAGSDKTIGGCTNEGGKTLPKAWEKSLPKDLTAIPEGGDPLVYWQTNHLPHREGGREFSLRWTKLTE